MGDRFNVKMIVRKLKTKAVIAVSALGLVLGGGLPLAFFGTVHAFPLGCVPVTTSKGALTAAQVGGDVNGDLDATGCDIGVYYNGLAPGDVSSGARIHDANQYGVFVDGNAGDVSVNVNGADIYNIGNHTAGAFDPNGVQTGLDVYYDGNAAGQVSGQISGSYIYAYQKGGVVISGSNASADTTGNTVTGLGKVDYIAQNGIEYYSSNGVIRDNSVSNNYYTGTAGVGPNPGGQNPPGWQYTAGGILLYEAANAKQSMNHFSDNQRNLETVS